MNSSGSERNLLLAEDEEISSEEEEHKLVSNSTLEVPEYVRDLA